MRGLPAGSREAIARANLPHRAAPQCTQVKSASFRVPSRLRCQPRIGVGPITADAAVATVDNALEFKRGRQIAVRLGWVPTQHSSDGFTRLGTISCRVDACTGTLLIQRARSSLQRAKAVSVEKATPEQLWIRSLLARLPFGKLIAAIASKHARQLWVMLARDVDHDTNARHGHPLHLTEAAA